jgi:hypothetical protein
MLLKEAAVAWEASKKPAITVIDKEVLVDGVIITLRETKTEPSVGAAAFHKAMLAVEKRRAELLGLDAVPASQKRMNDTQTAMTTVELMRLAESEAIARIVDGPAGSYGADGGESEPAGKSLADKAIGPEGGDSGGRAGRGRGDVRVGLVNKAVPRINLLNLRA